MSDHRDTDLTDPHGEAEALREERDALRAELESLSACACIVANGEGVTGDEGGSPYCKMQKERDALRAEVKQLLELMSRANAAMRASLTAAEAEPDAMRAENDRLRNLIANPEMTRDELIWSDYMRGVSPDKLAKQHKVTRERMRQILKQIAQRVVHLDAMALDRARAALKGDGHE